jgi:hypothetical protein
MTKPKTAEELAAGLQGALGSRLVAFLLYGSAARGGPVAAVDTLLIVDAVDEPLFALLEPLVAPWSTRHPAPIILSEAEWRSSADVFAIEYQDMRGAYRVLAGKDPWAGITVQAADVRRQLEQELMGKLVRLRQAYVAWRGDPKRLAEVVVRSWGGFLTMLRTALRLAGRTPPAEAGALVREAAQLIGFAAEGVAERRPDAVLAAVARTAEYVDKL